MQWQTAWKLVVASLVAGVACSGCVTHRAYRNMQSQRNGWKVEAEKAQEAEKTSTEAQSGFPPWLDTSAYSRLRKSKSAPPCERSSISFATSSLSTVMMSSFTCSGPRKSSRCSS